MKKVLPWQQIWNALLIVLDSMGIRALPDAAEYGDQGSDTLGNICRAVPSGVAQPGGAGAGPDHRFTIGGAQLLPAKRQPGRVWSHGLISPAKDTLTGHWELMGLITERPFQTFPEAFPEALIALLEQAWGAVSLGTKWPQERRSSSAWGRTHWHRIPDHLHIGGQRVANRRP